MDPMTISFWTVVGVATAVIAITSSLSIKIKSLKKSLTVEEREKISQLSDLQKRASTVAVELARAKRNSVTAQNEIDELKDREVKTNTEVNRLKKILEGFDRQRDQLSKKLAAREETISSQYQKLKQVTDQHSKLQGALREKEKLAQKLQVSVQDMTTKIQGLESSNADLSKENKANQKTVSHQQQELSQLSTKCDKLQDALQENEQELHKFENANLVLAAKIQEHQALIEGLNLEKKSNQENISRQEQELEQIASERSELRKILLEKEKLVQKLQDSVQDMTTQIQEFQSQLKVLSKEHKIEQETVSDQRKELEQLLSQRSEFQDAIQEKEQLIQKLQDSNQGLTEKIQELEPSIVELHKDNKANKETISHQQQELKQASVLSSEFQGIIQEKEQLIQKLQASIKEMTAKLNEVQAQIQGLEKETQAHQIIIAEFKKGSGAKKSSDTETESAAEEKKELEKIRENKGEALGESLLANKLITKGILHKALDFQKKHEGNLLQFLFVNKEIDENRLTEVISAEHKIPYLPLGAYEISQELVKLVPPGLVQGHWLLPVDKAENKLIVVMVDPFDNVAIKKIEELTGRTVQAYVGLFSEIVEKIQHLYQVNVLGVDAEKNPVSPLFVETLEYKGRERRGAVRFKSKLSVGVADDKNAAISTTENISWDGLSFELDYEMPVYSMVTVQLSMPESKDEEKSQLPMAAMAQVIRSTPLENNNFMIGVKLLKAPKEDLDFIIKSVSGDQKKKESETSEAPGASPWRPPWIR